MDTSGGGGRPSRPPADSFDDAFFGRLIAVAQSGRADRTQLLWKMAEETVAVYERNGWQCHPAWLDEGAAAAAGSGVSDAPDAVVRNKRVHDKVLAPVKKAHLMPGSKSPSVTSSPRPSPSNSPRPHASATADLPKSSSTSALPIHPATGGTKRKLRPDAGLSLSAEDDESPGSRSPAACAKCSQSRVSNDNRLLTCVQCGRCYHQNCHSPPVTTVQAASANFAFQCDACSAPAAPLANAGAQCAVCKQLTAGAGNALVPCNQCSALYHQRCHEPAIGDEQRNDVRFIFVCDRCRRAAAATASRSKDSPARSGGSGGGGSDTERSKATSGDTKPPANLANRAAAFVAKRKGTSAPMHNKAPLPTASAGGAAAAKASTGAGAKSSSVGGGASGSSLDQGAKKLQAMKKKAQLAKSVSRL